MVTLNSSTGDELFTSTPSGGGGVTFCIGSDYYKLNYNWICGNVSSGDGGGVAHLGFSYNGDISKNTIIFNQTVNPTIPTSGGGIVVMGPAPDGQTIQNGVAVECGSVNDEDCVPGLSDGSGPGLNIDGNLILGNAAESGSGGGIRFQAVNGTDVTRFPLTPQNWYSVNVTNNIIANNVAGWDGAGVGLLDSLAVNFTNNTIVSNDTTASAGTLFNAYFARLAADQSPPPGTCMTGANGGSCTASQPQPAGLSASPNSPQLTTSSAGHRQMPRGPFSGRVAGSQRRLQESVVSAVVERHLLAKPCIPPGSGRNGHRRPRLPAIHRHAGSKFEPIEHRRLPEWGQLLGYRRSWRHEPDKPQLRHHAYAAVLGVDEPRHRLHRAQ